MHVCVRVKNRQTLRRRPPLPTAVRVLREVRQDLLLMLLLLLLFWYVWPSQRALHCAAAPPRHASAKGSRRCPVSAVKRACGPSGVAWRWITADFGRHVLSVVVCWPYLNAPPNTDISLARSGCVATQRGFASAVKGLKHSGRLS